MKHSTQNYLKTITLLTLNTKKASTKPSEIAHSMSISPAAVTDMLKKLKAKKYVDYKAYSGVTLTPKGKKEGTRMIRHHRLWESFLQTKLNIPWDKVHDEAERLEHACSDYLINQIDDQLNNPKFDPHGNPIPNKKGVFPKLGNDKKLSECALKTKVQINRVVGLDQTYLTYLDQQGIRLGTTLQIEEFIEFDNTYICNINTKQCSISQKAAEHIFVS